MGSMSVCLDQDQNAVDCADPNCTYGDCVTAGAAGATVTPNPSVPNTNSSTSAQSLSQLGSVMGQWGATIAGIVTNTPTVVTAQGARTGYAAVPTAQTLTSGNGLILLLVVGAVILVLVTRKS